MRLTVVISVASISQYNRETMSKAALSASNTMGTLAGFKLHTACKGTWLLAHYGGQQDGLKAFLHHLNHSLRATINRQAGTTFRSAPAKDTTQDV